MLTRKQVDYLHEKQNGILSFCQDLRMMRGDDEEAYFWLLCISTATALENACLKIDRVILEGSAEDD